MSAGMCRFGGVDSCIDIRSRLNTSATSFRLTIGASE